MAQQITILLHEPPKILSGPSIPLAVVKKSNRLVYKTSRCEGDEISRGFDV